MKYIDADRLKVEIEKHIKEVKDAAERFTPNIGFFDAKLSGIYDVMAIIDFLQQEQPKVDLNAEIEKELRLHYNDDQDVYWWNYLKNSFYHFYELGLKARKK